MISKKWRNKTWWMFWKQEKLEEENIKKKHMKPLKTVLQKIDLFLEHVKEMKLIPCFKIINDKDMILEFLSCKSFIFKYFKSENDFQIIFFDYGLFKITSNEIERENYLLSETINFIPNQKTNILNLGIIIYKMTFNEFIYNFNEKETIKQTIEILLPIL